MNTPLSSTLRLLLPTLGAALISGCQDRASNNQNPAGIGIAPGILGVVGGWLKHRMLRISMQISV